jgi:predicted enzyme related to lactoylglutathione lyase
MMPARTYPHGVTCWVDTEQPDLEAASHFYRGLFGWTLTDAMPPGAPGSYLIATLEGQDVAAIGPATGDTAGWNTYVAVDDADEAATAVAAAGGQVTAGPEDAGPGGRAASCRDPLGAAFRLWQARRRLGAQLTNAPGSWNFSDLFTPDPDQAMAFYAPVLRLGGHPDGAGGRVDDPRPGLR